MAEFTEVMRQARRLCEEQQEMECCVKCPMQGKGGCMVVADMAALEYKLVFEAAAKMFDVLAAARKKSDPIIRRTDDLGRVSIPREYRERLGIQEGDALEIEVDRSSGAIVMRKVVDNE